MPKIFYYYKGTENSLLIYYFEYSFLIGLYDIRLFYSLLFWKYYIISILKKKLYSKLNYLNLHMIIFVKDHINIKR